MKVKKLHKPGPFDSDVPHDVEKSKLEIEYRHAKINTDRLLFNRCQVVWLRKKLMTK